jgi:DNA-binding IclR family transcriptional regulator/sugar lactone lactonase YvrE
MPTQAAEGTAALEKALDVLDAVGASRAGLSQLELAARLALPRTTLYRLLGTLVSRGLLRRDPLRRVYCLGHRCFEYARTSYAMPDLVAAAFAELRALRDISGETTYLAALDGLEVVSLERCDGAHSQRSHTEPGQRKPLHCTSQGKAILSALPPEQRDALVKDIELSALTPRTITDRRRLHAELKLTATRGWSLDDEEIVPGVRCCGAAIIDPQGHVRGAISIAGPAFRLSMERLALLGPEVAEAARRIGAQLGGAAPQRAPGEVRLIDGDWAFEGAHPLWHADAGRLWWADRLAPAVHSADLRSDHLLLRVEDEEPIGALLPHEDGAALFSGGAWQHVGPDGTREALAAWPRRRFSAITNDARGALWACVPDGERWRVAELAADGHANGGWRLNEPANELAVCGRTGTVYIAAADSGAIYSAQRDQAGVRRLTTVPKGSGRVGGLAVDGSGAVWAALRGGWSVVRFAADGSMDRVLALPVPSPTAVAIGGADGDSLFITSERHALAREALDAAPLSGRLFVLEHASAQAAAA